MINTRSRNIFLTKIIYNIYQSNFYFYIDNYELFKHQAVFLIKFCNKNYSQQYAINLPRKDLYKILDLSPKSDINDIKKSYYKKAKEYHPDKLEQSSYSNKKKSEEIFRDAKLAYEILSNEESRNQYNKYIYSLYFDSNVKNNSSSIKNKTDSRVYEKYSNVNENPYYQNFYYDNSRMKDKRNEEYKNVNDIYDDTTYDKNKEKPGSYHNNINYKMSRRANLEYKNRFREHDDAYLVVLELKHYLTLAFIFVTLICFAIFLKRNPPYGNPFVYQNTVYYPKDSDPILNNLIKSNKVDSYVLQKLNYNGKI